MAPLFTVAQVVHYPRVMSCPPRWDRSRCDVLPHYYMGRQSKRCLMIRKEPDPRYAYRHAQPTPWMRLPLVPICLSNIGTRGIVPGQIREVLI